MASAAIAIRDWQYFWPLSIRLLLSNYPGTPSLCWLCLTVLHLFLKVLWKICSKRKSSSSISQLFFCHSSGWWAGLDSNLLPKELCLGFSVSWESSIVKKRNWASPISYIMAKNELRKCEKSKIFWPSQSSNFEICVLHAFLLNCQFHSVRI